MNDFETKDSGARHEFESGMVRDKQDGKTDYDLVYNGPMFDRWAELLTRGQIKYPPDPDGTPNWTKAEGEAELIRFRKSLARHYRQWRRGDTDEDHAAAMFFNVNGFEHVKAKLKAAKQKDAEMENCFAAYLREITRTAGL